jgi:glyceraldehyde-3-phosphate dehydrogenase/erythrose-4-phosphate dehydrogenase
MMKFSRFLSILAVAALAFGGAAYAQKAPQAGTNNTAQLMQSYRQKNRQLRGIQQKAIKNTPKLAAEMKQFQAEVNSSMRAHGYDIAKGRKHMKAMAAKLRTGKKMSNADRMTTMKSMRNERQKMMKARAAVMQDPKIQKDGQALQNHMIAAMKKQDSHTGQLLKDVKSLRMKIMATMAARRANAKNGG